MWTPPGAADAECVDIGNDLASTVMTLVEVHVVEIVQGSKGIEGRHATGLTSRCRDWSITCVGRHQGTILQFTDAHNKIENSKLSWKARYKRYAIDTSYHK